MDTPNPPHWTLYQCFGAFRSIWVHLGSFRKFIKVGAKHTELVQLLQKFVPRSLVRIFTMDALDPPHWTLNSCFSVFCSVWVHLGLFRYYTKLGAIWAKLVQLVKRVHGTKS